MNIALLGYGKEGQAAKQYFQTKYENAHFDVFENLTPDEFAAKDYSSYDIILRSPSVRPLGLPQESSLTRYFFDHCPCPIIGVTATKGKGTTCSFIKSLLDAHGEDAYLVGNIGTPSIEILDQLTPNSVVVYELSSFQLWDLEKSPHIAVLGMLEPDHLNVHRDYAEYLQAKSHITAYQSSADYLIYNQYNSDAAQIAATSKAHQIAYPFALPEDIQTAIKIPGEHNVDNATAAISAVACFYNISPDEYLSKNANTIKQGLSNFKGLPHRLEFVRKVGRIRFYDDSFSTNVASTQVAIDAFPDDDVVIIVGGRDKTNYADLPELYNALGAPNIYKIILIGESGHELAKRYDDDRFDVAESFDEAFYVAAITALEVPNPVVLLSPAAASFDMFKDVYDRGDQFKNLAVHLRSK